ncbi:MAG: TlpA family protein disulfide reductase [Meiothermus sp.]|uniref:TlpA family protein disulfide reductase n=1 Tax=Meiothermus sp. TaxID=1955249 RepID=UPI0025E1E8A9|nr:TlpA disulfide reductase family protein [Meiothermus sp.]MCS7057543.1 TlpA family protein disulfide reductase [Meiothermus sp.]MCS7193733.1 TlpA family protein disulfide reductase [Meiothermus sp.]MCX7740020.1 TlpA family protein disulfide reductase [Meiothermus sp.]MDW8089912.1 TlpA disulfide reductase family protein [Meiothermus sp.]MDW8481662.1 TlpA disulfide reductase family protein [Meiothermus sp.]
MRHWVWWAVFLGLLVPLAFLRPEGRSQEVLPSGWAQNREGEKVELRAFLGKPVVLNAWATWCPPCRREMPLLLGAAKAHPQLNFVFLNVSDGLVAVEAFEAELGLRIPNLLLDPEALLSEPLRLQGLPVTLFYDAQGRLVRRHIGEVREEELALLLQGF